MKLISFHHFCRSRQNTLYFLGKIFSGISTVNPCLEHVRYTRLV